MNTASWVSSCRLAVLWQCGHAWLGLVLETGSRWFTSSSAPEGSSHSWLAGSSPLIVSIIGLECTSCRLVDIMLCSAPTVQIGVSKYSHAQLGIVAVPRNGCNCGTGLGGTACRAYDGWSGPEEMPRFVITHMEYDGTGQ